jgi:hypothetical protein
MLLQVDDPRSGARGVREQALPLHHGVESPPVAEQRIEEVRPTLPQSIAVRLTGGR